MVLVVGMTMSGEQEAGAGRGLTGGSWRWTTKVVYRNPYIQEDLPQINGTHICCGTTWFSVTIPSGPLHNAGLAAEREQRRLSINGSNIPGSPLRASWAAGLQQAVSGATLLSQARRNAAAEGSQSLGPLLRPSGGAGAAAVPAGAPQHNQYTTIMVLV